MILNEIESDWKPHLQSELQKDYFARLLQFLAQEKIAKKTIFPSEKEIFQALKLTSFKDTKVVILGQDPYHGDAQAHGLSFSVKVGQKIPPSLRNIFKELSRDLDITPSSSGDLSYWAMQGVLLLNTALTVEAGKAASHRDKGWETLTDSIIQKLSSEKEKLVFLLWGNPAISKQKLINQSKHLVLTSPHPSPLSAHRGFIGNGHFSATNNYLKENNFAPINWAIPQKQSTLL
jgi:uracil-DNA glycosylase